MYADIAVAQDEVILLAERTVEIHVGNEVRLLVVSLIYLVKAALAHDTHHALAFGTQFVYIDIPRLSDDVVLFPYTHHAIRTARIDHAIFQHLVIGKGTIVDAYVPHLKVGSIAC